MYQIWDMTPNPVRKRGENVTRGKNGRGRDAGRPAPPSRPGEFHPEALTEPCVTVSRHTARAILEGCLPPPQSVGSSCCQLTKLIMTRMARPFGLRTLLRFLATTSRSVPALRIGTFGLAGLPLVPFPFSPPSRFSSSLPEPRLESRHLYPGHHMASKQVPAMLVPESGGAPVLAPSADLFRGLSSGSLAFVSLART